MSKGSLASVDGKWRKYVYKMLFLKGSTLYVEELGSSVLKR